MLSQTNGQTDQQNGDGTYTIRTMTRDELAIAVEWAAAEGWNPGLRDVDCFYAADPNGFLMGFLDGKPIASISVVKYGNTFGFLGFYIVKPEFRGYGYGIQIWQAGLDYLEGRNVGLDGVVEQQDNYVKSGFQLAHQNIRYEGYGNWSEDISKNEESADRLLDRIEDNNVSLVSLSSLSMNVIHSYDKSIFLYRRASFLNNWVNSQRHIALGLMDTGLAGYGVIRPCRQGYKIGPLFADTPEFAETLFLALKASVEPNAPFYLDVPSVNAEAIELAKKYRMNSVFETARMYTKEPLALPLNKIFGITTFELG